MGTRIWCRVHSSHSFVAGLLRLLRSQQDNQHCCIRWMVNDAVFVEHENVAGFTRGVLDLMVNELGFDVELLVDMPSAESDGGQSLSTQRKVCLQDRAYGVSPTMS